MKAKLNTIAKILSIAFFLYLFLVSIGLMGKVFNSTLDKYCDFCYITAK